MSDGRYEGYLGEIDYTCSGLCLPPIPTTHVAEKRGFFRGIFMGLFDELKNIVDPDRNLYIPVITLDLAMETVRNGGSLEKVAAHLVAKHHLFSRDAAGNLLPFTPEQEREKSAMFEYLREAINRKTYPNNKEWDEKIMSAKGKGLEM